MSVFKVRDAFLALTYEQQAMIVDDWMERTPIAAVMAPSAPKVAIADQSTRCANAKYTRDGLPYDERETESCDALLLNGYSKTRVADWFGRNRPNERTFGAWRQFAVRRRGILKAKGEIK